MMTDFRERQRRLLLGAARTDPDELPTPGKSMEIYGARSIAKLALDQEAEDANAQLRHVAKWFEHPHPHGRDPKGECDFAALKLARAWHLFHGSLLDHATKECIKEFFLTQDFASVYPSENHVLIFRTSRYLMAQVFPHEQFAACGKVGAELAEHDRLWLLRFIRFRAERGWGEFDSAAYLIPDWECLCDLFDFASDAAVRESARMMMDLLLADMAVDSLNGMYCGAHGRIYPVQALDHTLAATTSMQHLYFGFGEPQESWAGCPVEALTSPYQPQPLVIDIARNRSMTYENRERKHLHNCNDPLPENPIEGSIRKYTWFTPQYVIGAVQYQDPYPAGCPGAWYAHHQQHQWDFTIGSHPRARIFTHHPGTDGEHNYWTGDLGCGCGHFLQNRSALVALYDIPENQTHQFIHAYLPREAFDEVKEAGGIVFVRRGDVFGALRLLPGYDWTTSGEWADREIKSHGSRHGVVFEAGLASEFGNFAAFQEEISGNRVEFNEEARELTYSSERAGTLRLNIRGLREHNGRAVDLDYGTYDSPFLHSAWGSGVAELTNGKERAVLDFQALPQA
jgi:hypothetical protein